MIISVFNLRIFSNLMDKKAFNYGVVCAISSAVLMATIGVFSKFIGLSAETITFFRLFLGACFMLLYLILQGKVKILLLKPSPAIVLNGFFLAGFILFYIHAMNHTTMANAIMLIYLAPLVAAVYAHYFLNEKLGPITVFLLLAALFGFAMMLEFKLDFTGDKERLVGLGLALLSMLCYSGFILVNRMITTSVYHSTFYQLLIGGFTVSPFLLFSTPEISSMQLLLLFGVGFFPGFLAIYLAVVALRILEASTFGTLAYFEPLAVILFGWFIFGEQLTLLQIGGCLLILVCGIVKAAKT